MIEFKMKGRGDWTTVVKHFYRQQYPKPEEINFKYDLVRVNGIMYNCYSNKFAREYNKILPWMILQNDN